MSSGRIDRLRILVLIKGLGIGGAERLISEAARYWDREAFSYAVAYILPWKDQLIPDLEEAQVPVTCIGGRRGFDLYTARRLRRVLRGIDLVHAHLPSTGVLARLLSPVPVVYTEHNLAGSYRQPTRILNRLTFGRNAAVTAVSAAVADSLAGFPGPLPQVVPNGVVATTSPDTRARMRKRLGLAPDQILIAHVGNIRPHKGHETLVKTAGHLSRLLPSAVIVSAGGEKHPGDLERVRSMAAATGVADRLRFLGRIEDARPLLAAADVVINPADVEGLPLVLLEALALSRPVVATAVGGVPSVIHDGETGRLVAPGDAEALATAVADLALDETKARRMGEAGARLVTAEYGLETMVRRFEAIYRRLLSSSGMADDGSASNSRILE